MGVGVGGCMDVCVSVGGWVGVWMCMCVGGWVWDWYHPLSTASCTLWRSLLWVREGEDALAG